MNRNSRKVRSKRETLRERDGDQCWICGEPMDFTLPSLHTEAVTFDHVIRACDGGPDHNDNLRLAHRCCNESRGRFDHRADLDHRAAA